MRKRPSPRKDGVRGALLRARELDQTGGNAGTARAIDGDPESQVTVSKRQLVLAVGFWSCLSLLCYWRTFRAMETQWRTEPDYSHGYLIIPLALVLLFSRRGSFPGFHAKVDWMGLVLIGLAGALRIVSSLSFMDFLDGWSIVPWVAGIVWMFAGRKALWWAMPAICFLFLLVPLPYRIETLLSWKLQSVVTILSTDILRAIGLPAIADGNTIWIGELQMLIEEACSGLRIFVGMAAFAFFWASMIQRTWVDRIVVLIAALPLAILANTIRVVATCLSFYYLDANTAAILHDWEGVLMVFLAAGLLWCVMFFWQKLYFPSSVVSSSPQKPDGLIQPTYQKPKAVQWLWNLRLLITGIIVLLSLATCLLVTARYRTSTIAAHLSQLATQAHDAGDFEREVRWLSQLAAIETVRRDAMVRLAFATSENAKRNDKKESARLAVMRAITVLDPVEDKSTIAQLRRELIEILMGLGPSWANEVERQIVLLDAPSGDPSIALWLAKCLYSQARSGERRIRDPNEFQQDTEPWQWLASQPIGFVLEQAVEKNPDSIEVAAALLDSYFFQPDLFKGKFLNEPKDVLAKKGMALLERLREIEDGLAQWKSYTCELTIDSKAAKEFLVGVVPRALQRLHSSGNGPDSSVVWDMQLVLTRANQLSGDADYPQAIELYRHLIALSHASIPPKLLEDVYVGIGQALFRSGEIDESLAILKEGCERIGKKHGLAIFDAYAAYACTHADLGEADRSLRELADAIQTYAFQSLGGPAIRGEAKTYEQNRLNRIKWHADVVRASLDMRTGNSASAISKLTAAVVTQLQIPKSMRVEASAMLAQAYSDVAMWDLAARTLDEAVAISPEDRTLRLQAARAWERAGASTRAAEHWKALDDGSFESSLSTLQAMMANQGSIRANPSDPRSLEWAFEQAKLRLQGEKKLGRAPKREWLLDWLELSIATSQADIEEKMKSLMSKYPENGILLFLLIQEFTSLGNQAMVTEGMGMLERIKEDNASLWLEASLIRAVESGDLGRAAEIVKQSLNDPKQAKQAKEEVLAIALRSLETRCRGEELWTILRPHWMVANESVLFAAGRLLLELESTNNLKPSIGDPSQLGWDVGSELDQLVERLKSLEGPSGTLAFFLDANRALERFLDSKAPEDLLASAKLHAEIESRRPRWALSVALAGKIAELQGEPERAVEFFRKAITEGDTRIATVLDLVRQLNVLGRYDESEFEFERIGVRMGSLGQTPELAIASLSRERQIDRTLATARTGVRNRPGDVPAWLTLFQALQLRLLDSDDLSLMAEADGAIDKAIDLTGGVDPQLWLYKIRFASRYRGFDIARNVVDQLLASSVPERNRILLAAKSLLQLQDAERAKEILDAALASQPKDVDLQLAMVEYYRTIGDQAKVIAALEEAVRLAPSRIDVKNSLAMALVRNDLDSQSLPWDRVESLVSVGEKGVADKNQLFHAILLASRGDEQKTQQARDILKKLIESPESKTRDDALRYSIVLDQKLRKNKLAAGDDRRARDLSIEIQKGFDRLVRRAVPAAMDLEQYVDFLLASGKIEEIPEILDRLESLVGITEQTSALRIRLARARNEPERVLDIIQQTIAREQARNRTTLVIRLSEILAQQGLIDESVRLLQAAYKTDPVYLRALVDALLNQGEFEKGLEVCIEHAKVDPSPELISVIADSWSERSEWDSRAETLESILERGLMAHPDNSLILESVGSLRVAQFRYQEAFQSLEAANRLAPDGLLTLNNLAIAASEIPGKESLGLAMIERAIAKYGRMPDLIDSRGLVQLRCGAYREAGESFDAAYALRPDPRFRLHRIQVEMEESSKYPKQLAESLDLKSLRAMKLTPREQTALDRLMVSLDGIAR